MARAQIIPVALMLHAAIATPVQGVHKRATTPAVASSTVLGIASDPYWSRDSCTSVRVQFRELWTCRDSSGSDGNFASSTASWTNFTDNAPAVVDGVLEMYGYNPGPFFTDPSNECGSSPAGDCGNGTRYAIWQNSPPLPVPAADDVVNLYTWIGNNYISDSTLAQLNTNPPTSLYKNTYNASQSYDELPSTTLLNEAFWAQDAIPFGTYGWTLDPTGSTAYLYGQLNASSNRAVAQVPLASIEDVTTYTFWNGSDWTATAPAITDETAALPNCGTGGQGTFYYSAYFAAYVWIGGPGIGVGPEFYISTAPEPQGPWTDPTQFYSGVDGSGSLGSYSEQAHPGLTTSNGAGNDIYLTFTQVNSTYDTPLIHVVWQ